MTLPSLDAATIQQSLALTQLAPAKINLALHVTGQRSDGYHLLDMLVAFTEFGDKIHASCTTQDHFEISGPYAANIPATPDNLVLRARDAMRAMRPKACGPVSLILEKHLPIASGIGGGSSDAAATMIALNQLWGLALTAEQLCHESLKLGADVPMCIIGQLSGSPLLARGIGDEITAAAQMPALPIMLINDGTGIATPDVFRRLKFRDNPPLAQMRAMADVAAVCDYLEQTRNDLFAPATMLAPALPERIDLLRQTGGNYVQMSGSGATCFAIFTNQADADMAAQTIRQEHLDWFVVATRTRPTHVIR